ncbi:hypothetical protein KRR40_19515 [Niabella defluvii]|nr:hypothetical protein KRR40_19515 [Niabella sp. I65]
MKKLIMPAAIIAAAITAFVACRKDKNDAPVTTPPETIKAQSLHPPWFICRMLSKPWAYSL